MPVIICQTKQIITPGHLELLGLVSAARASHRPRLQIVMGKLLLCTAQQPHWKRVAFTQDLVSPLGVRRQSHLLGFTSRTANAVLMSPGFAVAHTWPPSLGFDFSEEKH